MRSNKELAATIRATMKRKGLTDKALGKALGVSAVMVEKIVCGDVVPSRHLEKQLVEVLGIPTTRVAQLAARREQKNKKEQMRESRTRKAA